jgi:hypothetical protein
MKLVIPVSGEYSPETKWTIKGESGSRNFVDICACIGFGSPEATSAEYQGHAFALMGRQSDTRNNLIGECVGTPHSLLEHVIDWKDKLGFSLLHVPLAPLKSFLDYAGANGLTYYRSSGVGRDGAPIYSDAPETWSYFKGYDHTCAVSPIPDDIDKEFGSFLASYQADVDSGSSIVADWCLRAISLSREGKRAMDHPLARAIVSCSSILNIGKTDAGNKRKPTTNNWYTNRM